VLTKAKNSASVHCTVLRVRPGLSRKCNEVKPTLQAGRHLIDRVKCQAASDRLRKPKGRAHEPEVEANKNQLRFQHTWIAYKKGKVRGIVWTDCSSFENGVLQFLRVPFLTWRSPLACFLHMGCGSDPDKSLGRRFG
jgi:hypothetical protein